MLLRLVRPVRRKDSSILYFVKRIPAELKGRVAGLKLAIPIGDETVPVTISERAKMIRVSLRTDKPDVAKIRQAAALAYLENVWRALLQKQPATLSRRQAHALAGDLYRAWADDERVRTMAIERVGDRWIHVQETPEERQAAWETVVAKWNALIESEDEEELERSLGPIIDRLLLAHGLAQVDDNSRRELRWAFSQAIRDGFANLQRNAAGDYSPDPAAERFPEWTSPTSPSSPARQTSVVKQSLSGLVRDWWKESKAAGLSISTYESYRNTMTRFVRFLRHDDAARVTAEDVVRFKDHRLAEFNQQTGEPISAKTVRDSDLAALKSIFQWAVVNRRMTNNPGTGITIKLGRKVRTRSLGFTADEAAAVLHKASNLQKGKERFETFAAKRWVPWLCAYTGARVGEMVQLRKKDVFWDNGWFITITPEAGTVKGNQAREVPLHEHLVELGFIAFVEAAAEGYLFLTSRDREKMRGIWKGGKNRVCEFVRTIVTDRRVAPNHAWRHTFKTIGREVEIQERVLDAICGHAPKTVGAAYGDSTRRAMRHAIARFPRFAANQSE